MTCLMPILAKDSKEKCGFTLIELIVVIAIVAILAAAAIPIYQRGIGGAGAASAKAHIRVIKAKVILGEVTAEKPYDYYAYKVIAYVKTDIWYAHPWQTAFASIKADGSWELESVERTPSPTQIGVFLVKKDYVPPPVVEDPQDIEAVSVSFASVPSTIEE